MDRFFKDRERTAESIFVHSEELRFLAVRRGLQSLAAWAAESMSLDAASTKAYEGQLIDAYVSGTPESALVSKVQTDLERAGKGALSTTANIQFSQNIAEAAQELRGL